MKNITLMLLVFCGLLSIFMTQAHALEVQRTSAGIVFMFESSTGKHCWGLPQVIDLSYFPTSAMDVEAAAKQFNWPKPAGDQLVACQALTSEIWKVQPWRDATTRPVYGVDKNGDKTDTRIDSVNVGTKCGTLVKAYSATIKKLTWRMVTGNKGKQGAAVCELQ